MAGLCEGGNEPSGSLKAICNRGTEADGLWRVLGISPYDLITWLGFSEVFPNQKAYVRVIATRSGDSLVRNVEDEARLSSVLNAAAGLGERPKGGGCTCV
ncbi:hypothetical protein ANN_14667 [Periplaneta americana]|uniref:Uncharacterized protein n=1 Tax=Periplaneta americana TaxID=6978 RepID=A0ABQ8SZ23_PERAM|nr:hypothetical protein ANN_14667 [Periplaneta americana]